MNVVCLSVVFSYFKQGLEVCVCVGIPRLIARVLLIHNIALVLYCIFFFLFWNFRFAFNLLLSVNY